MGFGYAMEALDVGRLGVATQAVGIARRALEHSVAYCGERKQFDRPIREFQARSEEHTSELQSPCNLVCRLLLEKKKKRRGRRTHAELTLTERSGYHTSRHP